MIVLARTLTSVRTRRRGRGRDRRVAGRADRPVGERGFDALLRWARGVDGERVWALEDCRHVSGSLERFLIGAASGCCGSRRI
jgi:hypothetical protein